MNEVISLIDMNVILQQNVRFLQLTAASSWAQCRAKAVRTVHWQEFCGPQLHTSLRHRRMYGSLSTTSWHACNTLQLQHHCNDRPLNRLPTLLTWNTALWITEHTLSACCLRCVCVPQGSEVTAEGRGHESVLNLAAKEVTLFSTSPSGVVKSSRWLQVRVPHKPRTWQHDKPSATQNHTTRESEEFSVVPYERILAVGWRGAEVHPDATSSELQTPGSAGHWMKLFWPSDLLWSPAASPADRSPSPSLRPTRRYYMKYHFSKDNTGLNRWNVV